MGVLNFVVESLTRSFVFNLFCALFSCTPQNELPSDPLFSKGNHSGIYSVQLQRPFVSTQHGALEGYVMRSIRQRPIYAFEGIPYAENTAGINRFKV